MPVLNGLIVDASRADERGDGDDRHGDQAVVAERNHQRDHDRIEPEGLVAPALDRPENAEQQSEDRDEQRRALAEAIGQVMDAEVQRAGREHDRHESADRKNEKEDFDGAEHRSLVEGTDHARSRDPGFRTSRLPAQAEGPERGRAKSSGGATYLKEPAIGLPPASSLYWPDGMKKAAIHTRMRTKVRMVTGAGKPRVRLGRSGGGAGTLAVESGTRRFVHAFLPPLRKSLGRRS